MIESSRDSFRKATLQDGFFGFRLKDETPNHSVLCTLRKRLGPKFLSKIFEDLRDQLKRERLMSEAFTFVDAAHLVSKSNLWEERDRAIQAKYEKLNNEVLPKVAVDKQARLGCKGKDKFWYGYKEHVMRLGLINKISITPANVTDAKGLKHVHPSSGAIYADKG